MHQAYIDSVAAHVEADPRIRAAWLEGSFGRAAPDRYSDIDVHLLLSAGTVEPFTASIEEWLSAIQPVVLCTPMFDGRIVNALTATGLRVDIVLHAGETAAIDPAKARVLVQKGDSLHLAPAVESIEVPASAQSLEQQTKEFWRCIALLPVVVGRNELITGWMGLTVEVNLLTSLILDGYGIVRDRGVKNLNQWLPADLRQQIEHALSMPDLSPESLAAAHLGLAQIMQEYGRRIAEQHAYPYPAQLESVVLGYVKQELALLGLHDESR